MATKKAAKQTQRTPVKKVAAKSLPAAQGSARKKGAAAKSRPVAKSPGKVAGARRVPPPPRPKRPAAAAAPAKAPTAPPAAAAAPAAASVSLGRPLVTQEEKLYLLFHDDYQARQVFEFLRVQTVKELEQFSQQQIIHLMSKPLRTTLDRIRQRLATFKRSLRDDEKYAAEFLKSAPPPTK